MVPDGCGSGERLRLTSQLRVKLGTIRPPITEIRIAAAAIPRREPRPAGMSVPFASRGMRRFVPAKTAIGMIRGKWRFAGAAKSSKAMTRMNVTGKMSSAAKTNQAGVPHVMQAIRPSDQRLTRATNGNP